MFDGSYRGFDIVNELSAVATLQLPDLGFVIEDGVLEDLLDVLVANLRRFVSWGPQVLPTVHSQVNPCVSKVFGLVIR